MIIKTSAEKEDKTLRIVVCEDNQILCDAYAEMIRDIFDEEGYGDEEIVEIVKYHCGEDVLKDVGDKDIVFMDVELGKMNGIEVSYKLKEMNPRIIIFIVTAYSQYIDDAFRVNAFRYINKDFDIDRLKRNVTEALQTYYTDMGKVLIQEKKMIYTKYKSEIIFIEAKGHGSIVHTNEKSYYSQQTMKEWKKKLDIGCFVQPHRSYIVNLNYIKYLKDREIYFENIDYRAFIAERTYKRFKKQYDAYKKIIERNMNY